MNSITFFILPLFLWINKSSQNYYVKRINMLLIIISKFNINECPKKCLAKILSTTFMVRFKSEHKKRAGIFFLVFWRLFGL